MSDKNIFQDYDAYSEEDHQTWATLSRRQHELRKGKVSQAYLNGYGGLALDETRIPRLEDISRRLESISGWTLEPVNGLIPTRDFFYMLLKKRYPVTVSIRKPSELDFSENPDIFHDVYGHLPLLTDEKFTKFLTAYCTLALKYVNSTRAVDLLGRFYWYTYEMGIIHENGEYKPYGGAIITSKEEIKNIGLANTPIHKFDIDSIFQTPYNPYKLQNEYFVITSFDELFNNLEDLEARLIEKLLLPTGDHVLRNYSLNENIGVKFNNVIGFLNDIQFKFPSAISFAAAQPDENYFNVETLLPKFNSYIDHLVAKTGEPRSLLINRIGQYNKTKGIVNDIVAEYLRKDENINIRPEHILVTVGAQEAFSIIVTTICNRDTDVILTEDPSYIGLSSFARVFGYNIDGVPINNEGIDLKKLKDRIVGINSSGKRVKLLYVIPDYQNPSGSCMPAGNRLSLLELARQYNFLIIEDNVYNSFTYAQKKNPSLKSLDRYNSVIYVGSFSKSLFPGLRIGLIAADQQIENEMGAALPLIDQMEKVKAQLTNNTSTVIQAILGGILLDLQYSLGEFNKPKFETYKKKRDHILACLDKYIRPWQNDWAAGIDWNEPEGGFFIKLSLPFTIDDSDVEKCAGTYNVLFCPMRYFYLKKGGEREIRLAFSNLTLDDMEQGIKNLADFLRSKTLPATKKTEMTQTPEYSYSV